MDREKLVMGLEMRGVDFGTPGVDLERPGAERMGVDPERRGYFLC